MSSSQGCLVQLPLFLLRKVGEIYVCYINTGWQQWLIRDSDTSLVDNYDISLIGNNDTSIIGISAILLVGNSAILLVGNSDISLFGSSDILLFVSSDTSVAGLACFPNNKKSFQTKSK